MALITDDEWIDQYQPLPAPNPGNGFDFGDGCTLIDGDLPGDEAHLATIPNDRIWTVIDGDDRVTAVAGRHFINRLGYIITTKPHAPHAPDVNLSA